MRGGCVQSAGDEPITAHHGRGAPAGVPARSAAPVRVRIFTRADWPGPVRHADAAGRPAGTGPRAALQSRRRTAAATAAKVAAALGRPRFRVTAPGWASALKLARAATRPLEDSCPRRRAFRTRPRVDSESPGPRAERRGAGALGPAGLRPGPTLVGRADCRGTRICAGPLDFRVDASSRLCPCMPVWSCADAQRFCAREGRAGRVAAVAEGPWRGPPSESTFPSRLRRFPRTSATACAITRVLWAAPPL